MSRGEAVARQKRRAKLSLSSYLSVSVSPFVPGFSLFSAQPLSFYLIFFLVMNQNNTSFLSLTWLTQIQTQQAYFHTTMLASSVNLQVWWREFCLIWKTGEMESDELFQYLTCNRVQCYSWLQTTVKRMLNWRLNTGFECQTNDSRIASLRLKFLTGLVSDCDF